MSQEFVYGIDPRPIPEIARVEAGPGTIVTVEWVGGGGVTVDLAGWIALHDIEQLRVPAIFAKPEIGPDGDTVQWAGDEDLSIDSVHLQLIAEQQAAFGAADLAAWQARRHVSNQEAADLFGLSPNTWLNYKNGATRIPGGVVIAIRAMDRDPMLFEANFRPRRNGRPPAAG